MFGQIHIPQWKAQYETYIAKRYVIFAASAIRVGDIDRRSIVDITLYLGKHRLSRRAATSKMRCILYVKRGSGMPFIHLGEEKGFVIFKEIPSLYLVKQPFPPFIQLSRTFFHTEHICRCRIFLHNHALYHSQIFSYFSHCSFQFGHSAVMVIARQLFYLLYLMEYLRAPPYKEYKTDYGYDDNNNRSGKMFLYKLIQ